MVQLYYQLLKQIAEKIAERNNKNKSILNVNGRPHQYQSQDHQRPRQAGERDGVQKAQKDNGGQSI